MNVLEESAFFGTVISITSYGLGMLLKKKTGSALANPMLIAIILIIAFLLATGMDCQKYRESCNIFSKLLTPATICLAVPLYEQRLQLKQNYRAVMAGIAAGTITSLITIFIMALAIGLNHAAYVSLLPKSITMPIGMSMTAELQGIVPVTIICIVVTGVFGNVIADKVFRLIHVDEPVAKGIATGTASHIIGTARAMEMGPVEGAMSSLSIVVAGIMTVFGATLFSMLL